ncbi:MAG: phosphatidate cytidylyltransferase [Firmicutes bacterium]|nr:phosphatidate cytidylyltransferase [Bacillota bacterium]
MRARIITAALGLPLVLAAVYLGTWYFFIAIGIVTVLALYEFSTLFYVKKAWLWSLALTLPWYLNLAVDGLISADVYLLLYLTVVPIVVLVLLNKTLKIPQGLALIFGGLYIPMLLSTLVLIRQLNNGLALVFAVLFLTWGTDTGAYFIGKAFGKAKLAPMISPNKSWAGAIGGLGAAVIIAFVFGILTDANLYGIIAWGFVVSTAGQLGDLCESAIKRFAGIKDSGNLLPGHGGFYDRIDSLLFTSAISYIFFTVGI